MLFTSSVTVSGVICLTSGLLISTGGSMIFAAVYVCVGFSMCVLISVS